MNYSVLCSTLIALSVASFLPMINTFGIAITNGICVVLIWITFWYVIVHSLPFKNKTKHNFTDNASLGIAGYVVLSNMVTR